MEHNKILYCCYSIPQKNYLKNNGIRYELGGKSLTTNSPFWVYIRTKKLDMLLEKWSREK